MQRADNAWRRGQAGRVQLTPKLFLTMIMGLLLAALAFSQAAASIGLVVNTFRPLGGSFFSWRAGQASAALKLYQNGADKNPPTELVALGVAGLSHAPLSARSLWIIGKGLERQGKVNQARKVMQRAETVSRRDAAVQMWLAEDDLRNRQDIKSALRHYDLIVRAQPEANAEMLTRLAAIISIPEGRRQLAPYIRPDNVWLGALLTNAANSLPRAEPVGRLLLERGGKVPDLPVLDNLYAQLIERLVSEGSADIALRLYPLLPKGDRAALTSLSGFVDGKPVKGYPPFIWAYGNDGAGATPISLDSGKVGIEFYGPPGVIGVAATKLLTLPKSAQLRWRIDSRSNNLQSAGTWEMTCLRGRASGRRIQSVNMFDAKTPQGSLLTMALPADCDLVRIDMRINGGIGTGPVSLILSDLQLSAGATLD